MMQPATASASIAVRMLKDRAAELRTEAGRRRAEWHENDAEMVAAELLRMARRIAARGVQL